MADIEKQQPTAAAVPVSNYGGGGGHVQPEKNCMAVASLVCGIVGLFIFGVVLGTLAIIFGGVAMSQMKGNPAYRQSGDCCNSHCQAVTGLVLGIISVVIWAIIIVTYF